MNILIPNTITAAMLQAGTTIAEPAAGETAWVSAGSYTLADLRIRSTTHRVYKAIQTHTGRTALPEDDPLYWLDFGPTQRLAPFDAYVSTAAETVTALTYVLQPGFFNSLSLYGLAGASITVTVKDAPAGATTLTYTGDLFEQAAGLYELLFTPLAARDKLVIKDIPLSPTAELTIAITAGTGDPVAVGMINIGDYRAVIGEAEWGGTEYGASAEPKSFSYIKFNEDGTSVIKRRGKATDMRGSVAMPEASANYAFSVIKQALDIPVSIIATTASGYDYLNVFGLISANLVADNFSVCKLNFSVKGFI